VHYDMSSTKLDDKSSFKKRSHKCGVEIGARMKTSGKKTVPDVWFTDWECAPAKQGYCMLNNKTVITTLCYEVTELW